LSRGREAILVKEEIRGTSTPANLRLSMQVYSRVPIMRIATVSGRFTAAMTGLRAMRKCMDFLTSSVFISWKSSALAVDPKIRGTGILFRRSITFSILLSCKKRAKIPKCGRIFFGIPNYL
jgi:hypothetical protein